MATPFTLNDVHPDLVKAVEHVFATGEWKLDTLVPFTEANFLALIRSAEGTPYRLGGIDPFHGGADCSGLIYWAALQCGKTLPRTTSAEWAGLPHSTNWRAAPVGSIVEFEVPSDGPPVPQHVGVVVGAGLMIDDPFTGAVVRQETIPNAPPAIWPIGYCTLPFVGSTPVPVPTPVPTPTPIPIPTPHQIPQEIIMGLPTGCTDQNAVRAQIREWWITFRSDVMSANDSNLFTLVFYEPATSGGYGGNPDLLLAGIVDGGTTANAIRPQWVNAV